LFLKNIQNHEKLILAHMVANYMNSHKRNNREAFLKSFKGPNVWRLGANASQSENFLETRFCRRESLIFYKSDTLIILHFFIRTVL